MAHHSYANSANSNSYANVSDEKVKLRTGGPEAMLYQVWAAFEFLTLIALLGFLAWSFSVRQLRSLPTKALVGSILSFICVRITNIINVLLFLCKASVAPTFVVISIFTLIFYLVAMLFGFFVFWHLIHELLESVAGRNSRKAAIAHWVILAIFSALAISGCITYIASIAEIFTGYRTTMYLVYLSGSANVVLAVLSILFFAASIEIGGWTIFIHKARTEKTTGFREFAFAFFFFFVAILMNFIIEVVYVLALVRPPIYQDTAKSVVEFVCIVGVYTGLLKAFKQWCYSDGIGGPKDTEDNSQRQMMGV